MLRVLLERKDELAPLMTRIWLYYAEKMSFPGELQPLARRQGVRLGALFREDDILPAWDWLVVVEDPLPENDNEVDD